MKLALLALSLLTSASFAHAASQGFISASGRADIAFDTQHDVLFISGEDSLRRYDINNGQFLAPITLGGKTLGMDISPDGKILAVANASRTSTNSYVDLINLESGTTSRVNFDLAFYEGGTYSVAFDKQGKLLVSTSFEGSGWVPLRKYDLQTSTTLDLGSIRQDSMLSASGDRSIIGIAEANISDGAWGYYRSGDTSYTSQHQWYDPVTGGTGWFNFEIGVSRDGNQFSIPTYGGTFIGDAKEVKPLLGEYAGESPIGVAYSPVADRVFFPIAGTHKLSEYDTQTLQEVRSFEVPGEFNWPGNSAFDEGRTKVAADGSFVFSTLDDGIFYAALTNVPEPSTYLMLLIGILLLIPGTRKTSETNSV